LAGIPELKLGRRGHWYVLAVIILVGLLIRGLYLSEIAPTADFSSPTADAHFHDYWARALLADEWSPPPGIPNPYINSVPFIRPPGYPYFLSLAYALTGESYLGARIIQMLLGVLSCWLAFLLGRLIFNRAIGLILAGFGACYWTLIYFEGELHAPVLLITLSLVFMIMMAKWLAKPTFWKILLAGLILGLMALVRPNTLLFVPAAAAWSWWNVNRSWQKGRALIPAFTLILGVLISVCPATIRNVVVAKDFVPISANGAINLHIGNNPTSDGVTTKIPDLQDLTGQTNWSCFAYDQIVQGVGEREGYAMKYSQVSNYFWRQGLEYIAKHPVRFLSLTLRRAALFWGPAEVSNNKAIQFEKDNSNVLRFIPGFPLVLALSLLGTILLYLDRRKPTIAPESALVSAPHVGPLITLVMLYILMVWVSFLPFLVAARFRTPLIPFIFLFGAYGLYRIWLQISAQSWANAGKLIVSSVVLVIVCNLTPAKYESDRSWWHTDRALALSREGKIEAALQEYNLALAENPGYVDAHVNLASLLTSIGRYDGAIRHYQLVKLHRPDRLDVRIAMAAMLTQRGRGSEAVIELKQILAQTRNLAQAHFELGRAYLQVKQFDKAEQSLREAITQDPSQLAAVLNLGIALAKQNRLPAAKVEYRRALRLNSRFAEAYQWLGIALCSTDSIPAGIVACERALELDPNNAKPAIELGNFYSRQQHWAAAVQWSKKAIEIDPRNVSAHNNLGAALANQGKYAEAEVSFEAALELNPQNQMIRRQLETLRDLQKQQQQPNGTGDR